MRGGHSRRERDEDRFFRLVDALTEADLSPDTATEVAVLTVGAGLISAAVADPARADLISRVCTDAIVAKLTTATRPSD
ncbi:MAG: hypothetical protein ACI8S6_005887 [Myxococcota bacterium]